MEEKQQFKTSRPAYQTLTAEIQAMLEDEPAHNWGKAVISHQEMEKRKQKIAEMDFVFTKKMPVKREIPQTTISLEELENAPRRPKKLNPEEIELAKWMKENEMPISMDAEAAIKAEAEGISLEDAYAKLQASKQDHEKASENPEIAPAVTEKAVDLERCRFAICPGYGGNSRPCRTRKTSGDCSA